MREFNTSKEAARKIIDERVEEIKQKCPSKLKDLEYITRGMLQNEIILHFKKEITSDLKIIGKENSQVCYKIYYNGPIERVIEELGNKLNVDNLEDKEGYLKLTYEYKTPLSYDKLEETLKPVIEKDKDEAEKILDETNKSLEDLNNYIFKYAKKVSGK